MRTVGLLQPLTWLALGWRDIARAPALGFAHGLSLVLLSLAATGWVVISASLISLLSPVRVQTPLDFLQHVVLARDGQLFALWRASGRRC